MRSSDGFRHYVVPVLLAGGVHTGTVEGPLNTEMIQASGTNQGVDMTAWAAAVYHDITTKLLHL